MNYEINLHLRPGAAQTAPPRCGLEESWVEDSFKLTLAVHCKLLSLLGSAVGRAAIGVAEPLFTLFVMHERTVGIF